MPTKVEKKPQHFYLSIALIRKLRITAAYEGRDMSAIATEAIEAYLKSADQKACVEP